VYFKRVGDHSGDVLEYDRVNVLQRDLSLRGVSGHQTRGGREGTHLGSYAEDVASETDALVGEVHPAVDHDFNDQCTSMGCKYISITKV
jgi:hypothetical protein